MVIRGGVVVNPDWQGRADLLIADSKVHALADEAPPELYRKAEVVDATGKWVLPGGVDPHVHVGIEFSGFRTADDFRTCGLAALHGGSTTIIDFAIPRPGQSPVNAVAERSALAKESPVDVALHGCVIAGDADLPAQLQELAVAGVTTVKMFTTYRGLLMVEPDTIRRVMEVLRDVGGLAYIHAETNHLIEAAQERLVTGGKLTPPHFPGSRPRDAEEDAVGWVLHLASLVRAPVYFVHQTTPRAVDLVRRARLRGVQAFSETCPHYLLLDETVYAGRHAERFICSPPMRDRRAVAGLMQRVLAGWVDTLGSDHCCFTAEQKLNGTDDFRGAPPGLPGVEIRLPLLFSELVRRRGMSPSRFVELVATNPARLIGLFPRKGILAPGSDADLMILNPDTEWTVHAAALHMPTDFTPFEGIQMRGKPEIVISCGQVVIQNGELLALRQGVLLRAGQAPS